MPHYDLEITAIFAPYPQKDEPYRSGDVKFKAETLTPEDDIIPGTVPSDLMDISAGAEVTFGVTANLGYEFDHWYFRDSSGKIVTPDNEYTKYGSGKFVMPDYDITAIAVFRKVDYSKLTIEIISGDALVIYEK